MAYEIKKIRGLFVSELLLMLINFILSIILYSGNQFKNGLLRDLSKNWKMNPITNIKIKKNENVILNKFNFDSKINWMNYSIELERMDSKYKYYNVLSNKNIYGYKKCGKDNDNNYVYFPKKEDIECPINFIEIIDSNNNNISEKNLIKLSDKKYLHFHNNNTEGKILVELKISQHYPCPNIDYDNDFCPLFESCNKNYKKCNLADYLLDKYSYEYLDYDLATNFRYNTDLKDFSNFEPINNTGLINNIDITEKIDENSTYYAFNQDEKILILYKRSWIGYYITKEEYNNTREVKSKLKNFINMENFCRNKNRTLLAFSILILIFIITKKIFNFLKILDYFFIFDFLIIIFLFINIILNSVSIKRFKSFNSNFFKYSIFNYFKHDEKFLHKIEISSLFFNCLFFIIELFLFFFDFYQIEKLCNKYNIEICLCCKSCMKIFNQFFDIKKEEIIKRTSTVENLMTDDNKSFQDLNLNEPSRIETEFLNQLKGMSKKELNDIIRNIIQNFKKDSLGVIREESKEISDSYSNVSEGIIDNTNNQNNIYIYNNNTNQNNINQNQNEIIFSQIQSEELIFEQEPQIMTLHGNFGYIKRFRIKNSEDNIYVLKIPILNKIEENTSEKLMKDNIIKINQLSNEIKLLKNFNHKNIVKCLGKRIDKDNTPSMVLENCEGGNLKSLLKNNNVTNEFKIKIIKQLAEALIYLHNKGYVHSDLKCDNILLDKPYNNNSDYPNLKLCDFGCCVKKNEKYNNGNCLYRAIEAIKNKQCNVTDKLDVYSYASTCYEIIKENPPFDGNLSIFKKNLKENNYHPNVNDLNCSNEMKELLLSCWNEIPEQRPNMKEILEKLETIQIFDKDEI